MLPMRTQRSISSQKNKCDEGRPACGNCIKRKQECPGYRSDFDIMLKDQTNSVPQKAKRKQAAKERKRALDRLQSQDEETIASNDCRFRSALIYLC